MDQPQRSPGFDPLALLEGLADAVICTTRGGQISYANPAALALLGCGPELLGQDVSLLVPDPQAQELGSVVSRIRDGEQLRLEGAVRRADGSLLQVALAVAPQRQADGEIAGFIGSLREVGGEQAHARLHNGAARLLEQTDIVAMIVTDAAGVIRAFNRGAERMLGYAAQEVVGLRTPYLFHDSDEVEMHRRRIGAASNFELFQAVAAQTLEVPDWGFRRRDGTWIRVAISLRAAHDAAGLFEGFVGLLRDVTEVRAAEIARRRAEERFRIAYEHAPIGLAITGISGENRGRFIHTNPVLARMVGREPGELDGLPIDVIGYPDDRTITEELLSGVREEAVQAEKRYLRADGTPFWALVTATPVPRPDGGPPEICVVQVVDISERRRFEAQLHYLADHDPLTGLHNRRAFEAELERRVEEARAGGRGLALLALDLDGFKVVNDRFGHTVGDELVAQVGGVLRRAVREQDFIARIGGDEFAIILRDCHRHDAVQVAEKLLDAIRQRGLVAAQGATARVTTSIGVALLDPGSPASGAELAVAADIAMYEAKADGRNGFSVYAPDGRLRPELVARDSWFSRLRRAIDDRRLELFAQPIVPISGGGRLHYELLLRLRDDGGELVPPGAFMFDAERFELVGEIDRWVLGQAVQILHRHQLAGQRLSICVNLSGHTMNDLSLADDLAALMESHPVPAGSLVVEVTETAAIVNIDRARELAQQLRRLGCRFALDDFGAGFASFYYLKHLEFDYLKIDGEFITRLVSTEVDRLVVRAVVDIARGLGSETVAEFVGDDATVSLLRELGVDYGQGYHLGMPGPVAETLPRLNVS